MESENKSLITATFDFWSDLPTAGRLLIGGTAIIWIIWMFWIAVAPGLIETKANDSGSTSYLPAISESETDSPTADSNQIVGLDETAIAAEDESEVYLPTVNDESALEEPIVIVVNEAGADAAVLSEDAIVFTIDPDRSAASYSAVEEFFGDSGLVVGRNTNEGLNTAVGETRGLSGSLVLDMGKGSPKVISGEFAADLLQLTSVQPHRDNTIKNYWLESTIFPVATFKITQLPTLPPNYTEGTPAVFPLTGILTVRDIEKEVTFQTTTTLEDGVLKALATTEVMFEDFGIAPPNMANVLRVDPSFTIIVSITAVAE